jgi:hypothetical protein
MRGFATAKHRRQKSPLTYRIAVIGDSFAEAMQVPLEDTFWFGLRERLQACPAFAGSTIEALNFAVSDYGTAQELLTERTRVWPYVPDLVLLLFSRATTSGTTCGRSNMMICVRISSVTVTA